MSRQGTGPRLRYRRKAWIIRWTENGRSRERCTGATNREEAEKIFTDWLSERRERPQGLRRASEYLIADCLAEYLEEHGPEVSSKMTLGICVNNLLDWWGTNAVADITKATCQSYSRYRRGQGRKDDTIRRELGVLCAALGHSVATGRAVQQPKVWMPPAGAPKDKWLRRDEAARLLWAARKEKSTRHYLPLFILLGLYTAARKEAILTLRWSQIDLENGLIDFNQPGRTKTNKGRSRIPIPRRMMTFLKLARKRGSDLGPVLHINGKPIGNIKKSFNNAAIRAGLSVPMLDENGNPLFDIKGKPRIKNAISPHTLRHTCATWMAQRGTDIWKVAGYLGQSVARTTERYAHHHPDHLRQAADALDGHSVTNTVTQREKWT